MSKINLTSRIISAAIFTLIWVINLVYFSFAEDLPCRKCHPERGIEFSRSIHQDFECTNCHQIDNLPHGKVPVVDCTQCHAEIKALYDKSAHGEARVKMGLELAPNCNDCHNAHNVTLHNDPASIIYKTNIPNICGQCHVGVLEEYKQSIHGQALFKDHNPEAPACTDCHGVHTISQIYKPQSSVSPSNIPKTCAKCHAMDAMMVKYGIKTEITQTYKDSFHGKANLYGRLEVASCASCHGFHNIKAVSDPDSQVSKANLPKTCGKCHPGAINNPRFSESIMHLKASPREEPLVFYVRLLYIIFIAGLIGGMFIYNCFDFYYKRREKRKCLKD
jgi:hypothetical protein